MKKSISPIKRFAGDEDGAALMEYTILLGTMVVAVIAIMSTVGGWVSSQWKSMCTQVKSSSNTVSGNC